MASASSSFGPDSAPPDYNAVPNGSEETTETFGMEDSRFLLAGSGSAAPIDEVDEFISLFFGDIDSTSAALNTNPPEEFVFLPGAEVAGSSIYPELAAFLSYPSPSPPVNGAARSQGVNFTPSPFGPEMVQSQGHYPPPSPPVESQGGYLTQPIPVTGPAQFQGRYVTQSPPIAGPSHFQGGHFLQSPSVAGCYQLQNQYLRPSAPVDGPAKFQGSYFPQSPPVAGPALPPSGLSSTVSQPAVSSLFFDNYQIERPVEAPRATKAPRASPFGATRNSTDRRTTRPRGLGMKHDLPEPTTRSEAEKQKGMYLARVSSITDSIRDMEARIEIDYLLERSENGLSHMDHGWTRESADSYMNLWTFADVDEFSHLTPKEKSRSKISKQKERVCNVLQQMRASFLDLESFRNEVTGRLFASDKWVEEQEEFLTRKNCLNDAIRKLEAFKGKNIG